MINVFGSSVGKEELDNISKCIQNQWLGFGEYVENFEDKFKLKYNLTNFAMVDSGSNALFMAITLLDLPKNSEIILPSFTWVSCAQAVILAGHRPVFCDVDLDTMNVRAVDIEKQITGRTRAVMIVDDLDWSNSFFKYCSELRLYPHLAPDNGKDNLIVRTGIVRLDHPYNGHPAITGNGPERHS